MIADVDKGGQSTRQNYLGKSIGMVKYKRMEFSRLQELVIEIVERYCARFNISLDATYAQLKLHEEVGEFAQAVLRHQGLVRPEKRSDPETTKTAIADELADVIGMAILNAHLLDIDLEAAFARKWFDKLGRDVTSQ